MVFVPVRGTYSSAAAMDLGQRLTDTIRQYQEGHPGLSRTDIQGAIRIAESNTCASPLKLFISLALVIGAFVFGVAMFAAQMDKGGGRDAISFLPMILAAMVGVAFLVIRFARRP